MPATVGRADCRIISSTKGDQKSQVRNAPYYDAAMRGDDQQSGHLFSYLSPEQRVPADHPLRAIRQMTDAPLRELSPQFERLYATTGRPSIPPEQLLRALLLQSLYSVRSERMLVEQL
jgi:hypothetical protein